MRRVRVIPVLAIDGNKLVKTIKFNSPKYIGDPINAIKIFNDKEVDEIVVVDITASRNGRNPNFKLIEEMAGECFMPMAYGGGILTFDQVAQLFRIGVEKVILNSILLDRIEIIKEIVEIYGSQSVVVSVDIRRNFLGKKCVSFCSGTKSYKISPVKFAEKMEQSGAGELIIHSVDREGTFSGYDLETLKAVTDHVSIPIVALGGARNIDDFLLAIREGGASAVAASSIFVYKKNDPRSILINYPAQEDLKKILFSSI